MQPRVKSSASLATNWLMTGQLIDQFPAAVVVVNGPPFRGPLITCRPRHRYWPHLLPAAIARPRAAVVGYAVLVPAERIARQKRHGSTAAELDVFLLGGTNVIS
jgi:hypothetical protein